MFSSSFVIKVSKQFFLCLLLQSINSKANRSTRSVSTSLLVHSFSLGRWTVTSQTPTTSRPPSRNIVKILRRRSLNKMQQQRKSNDNMDYDILLTSTSSQKLNTSNQIQTTLDPCVVLMKQLISKYSHLWDGDDRGGIYSLAQGVVYWEPPTAAYDELSRALIVTCDGPNTNNVHASEISNDLHQYCPDEGLPSLIQAVKEKLERENGIPNVGKTQVIITAGANQAYMNCVLSILSEGMYHDGKSGNSVKDACIVFKPYYFNHVMAVQMTRGNDALLIGPIDKDGIPCIDWLRQTLSSPPLHDKHETRIKMVTITNPGNPTGVSIPREKLQNIVDLCREYGVWVVMDNTYEHFDYERLNSFDISSCMKNKQNDDTRRSEGGDDIPSYGFRCFEDEHVINIFSFSKGYAMAGFRVGYVVINANGEKGKILYDQMVKVQDTIPICTSRLSQLAAYGALSAGRHWVHNKVNTLQRSREAIVKALEPLDIIIGGSGAMYLMGKLPDNVNDDIKVGEMLVKRFGIAIIPGSFCGYPNWIRVCYSNLPPEKCLIAAERLAKGIAYIASGDYVDKK